MTSSFEVTTIGGKKRKTEDEQIYTIFVSGVLVEIRNDTDLVKRVTL